MKAAAFFVLLFINVLFLYKYGLRVTSWMPLTCLVYGLVAWGIMDRLQDRRIPKWLACASGVWILGVAAVAHLIVPLEGLDVDRWSVISSFLDSLYSGDYPYSARSHMGNPPGPMPVYFLVAAPFHALGVLELLSAAGYLAALVGLYRSRVPALAPLLLLLSSPFLYWEIAVRSNLFTFSLLVLWGLERFVRSPGWRTALVTGLFLSTRSVFVLAYLIYFAALLRSGRLSIRLMTTWTVASAAAFGATFLPFLLIWPEPFRAINPFLVQGTFLVAPIFVAVFFLMAAVLAWRSIPRTAAALSGLTLFLAILIYGVVVIGSQGWADAYLNSGVDISYFIFCAPFLLYLMVDRSADSAEPIRSVPLMT